MTQRLAGLLGWVLWSSPLLGAAAEPQNGAPTPASLEAWLTADPAEADTEPDAAELTAPPPAPRRHGVVIEGGLGALGHLGDMKHISPVAPSFRLQAGYEIFRWLLIAAEGDLALCDTAYAHRPPEKRGYALYGFGAAARLGWQPWHVVGLHLQADAGLSSVTDDVLSTYGYRYSTGLRPYLGATIGVDWFQINPHYALGVYAGVRDYPLTFQRAYGSGPPLAWISGVALRYAL